MKKIIAILLAVYILILSMCACSGEKEKNSPDSETNTQSTQQDESIQPTSVQQTSAQSNEIQTAQVNSAYLKYLEENSKWFTNVQYSSKAQNCNISFADLNGDGIEELIHIRPDDKNNVYLTVLTYDSGLKTVYDQPLFSNAGAEVNYSVFLDDDSKMYSVALKSGQKSIIRYNYENSKFTSDLLGEETGGDPQNENNNTFTVNGKECTAKEFSEYKDKILDSADTLLIHSDFDDYTVKDNSMSYEEACKHVGSTAYDTEWKKLYLQTLNELDDSQYNGYMLAFINEDDIPELLAIANSKATPSHMYWVFDEYIYNNEFMLNSLLYLEKKNTFLFHKNSFPITQDTVLKIENKKTIQICNGEINSLAGEEYYKWNNKDVGSLEKYNQELNNVINEKEAKTIDNIKSLSEIIEEIKNY